jgi:hypothetical protein
LKCAESYVYEAKKEIVILPDGKSKFIEDAARVIDGRVARLKEKLVDLPGDRAAIMEAEFCARHIRALAIRPYRGDPYEVAHQRWLAGEIKR